MPTIHTLEIFITLYQTRSVTKTAKTYFCSQPSISRTIKDLEKEYNTLLFERYQHSLIPTEKATILYNEALQVLDSYETMNHLMLEQNTTIRVGSTVTISSTILPSIIKAFNKDVRIEVTVSNGASLQQDLIDNKLDIALIENEVNSSILNTIPFSKDNLVLVVSTNNPLIQKKQISLKEIENYPFLHREQGSAVREYLDNLFNTNNIQIDTIWQSRSTEALINAVEEGIGITILPKKMCQKEIDSHRLSIIKIKDFSLERQYYVVHHKDKNFSNSLEEFKNLCLKY